MKKNILKSLFLTGLIAFSITACKEREFVPPNKDNAVTGSKENIVPVGSAINSLEIARKMAKVWDPDALLMSVNGIDIGVDGYNKAIMNGSRWIFYFYGEKKGPESCGYVVTFTGTGTASWLQNSCSYKKDENIENFTVDSSKAMLAASKAGLPEGKIYVMELNKNKKGMNWVIGSKADDKVDKYEFKKIDALSGEEVK
jgi:hypothetical protein